MLQRSMRDQERPAILAGIDALVTVMNDNVELLRSGQGLTPI
jgi:hypothetical protein